MCLADAVTCRFIARAPEPLTWVASLLPVWVALVVDEALGLLLVVAAVQVIRGKVGRAASMSQRVTRATLLGVGAILFVVGLPALGVMWALHGSALI